MEPRRYVILIDLCPLDPDALRKISGIRKLGTI